MYLWNECSATRIANVSKSRISRERNISGTVFAKYAITSIFPFNPLSADDFFAKFFHENCICCSYTSLIKIVFLRFWILDS